jgi:hypothetical protein
VSGTRRFLSRNGVTWRHSRSSVTARALRGSAYHPAQHQGAASKCGRTGFAPPMRTDSSPPAVSATLIVGFDSSPSTGERKPRQSACAEQRAAQRATRHRPSTAAEPQLTPTGGKDVMQQPTRHAQFRYPLPILRAGLARVDSSRRALAASDFGSRR